jgi:GT2 family glycosyltransferase
VSDDATVTAHDFAVLIVAYRSADKLEECLRAAERHLPSHKLYVWDNSGASYSDVRALAERFRDVHWFVNSENIGFAAAVNKLAAMVPSQDMLLLNPDAELLGPLSLTRTAIRMPGTAAAAPLVLEDGLEHESASPLSPKIMPWDVAHRRLTWLNAFGEAVVRQQRLRGTGLSGLYWSQPSEVDGYLTGACLAIRREAWESLGPFDEEYFLYGEESDWQRRATAAGWRICLADEVGVRHSGHGTVAGDRVASTRSQDLLRAGVALQLEYRYGRFPAECYLVGVSLIETVRERLRDYHGRGHSRSDVLITVDTSEPSASTSDRVSVASELAMAGYAVIVVSLGRLGSLPRDVPASIRLIRRPWWWPSTGPDRTPRVLVEGTTKKERAFARLFRLRRNRACVSPSAALRSLANMNEGHRSSLNPNVEDR